jgi:hypothetical protein
MRKKGNFATYKRRGEWVELIFMMRAAELEFNVSKPCPSQEPFERQI